MFSEFSGFVMFLLSFEIDELLRLNKLLLVELAMCPLSVSLHTV